MQMPGCLVCHTTAAQTIWINLFFYVSHTGTTVAACRWAASSRSWVYAAEQLHFFTSAITVFQEILSWQSFKNTNNVLGRNPLASRREILFWLRREILFWLLTALVGGAAHCGWLWILWLVSRSAPRLELECTQGGVVVPHHPEQRITPPPPKRGFEMIIERNFSHVTSRAVHFGHPPGLPSAALLSFS